jgi:hypothetical protein
MKAPLLVPGIAETDENPMNTKESFSNSICKEQMQMAEREFSAFISAVKELLGPDQAQLSAVDWLDELELMDSQSRICKPRLAGGHDRGLGATCKSIERRTA